MINLLEETISKLKLHAVSPSDVEWVGTDATWMAWDEFTLVASIDYDNSIGWPEVREDLIIVGKDWWLERHEYDGSEWWEFKKLPEKPAIHAISTLLDIEFWEEV